jgi:hypothetical protein
VDRFRVQTSAEGSHEDSEGTELPEFLKRSATISSQRYVHTSPVLVAARSPRGRSVAARFAGIVGFETRQGHGFLSHVIVGVLSGRGLYDELITRPEDSFRLWFVVVCDLTTSSLRRPWPTGGCLSHGKKKKIRTHRRS